MTDEVELWGTFSVADHLRAQPFVTDVLLYDRLVVPVPAAGKAGSIWKKDWDRDKLELMLDLLGDLAVRMPWGTEQSNIWKDRYSVNSAVVQDVEAARQVDPDEPAYYVTREILKDLAIQELDDRLFNQLKALAKRPGTSIEAVTAYGSADELKQGLGMQPAKHAQPEKQGV